MQEIKSVDSSSGGLTIELNGAMVLRDGKQHFRTGMKVNTLLAMPVGASRDIGRHGRGYLVVRWRGLVDIWHGKILFIFPLRDVRAAATMRKKK